MRTIAIVKQVFRNINKQMLLVENQQLDLDLEINKDYIFEVKELKSKRTIQQNKYMWALIREIAHHESIQQSEVDIYSLVLEEANAKYIYLLGTPEVEDELKKNFRAVRVVRPTVENGKEFIVYKCFVGTSKMDTKEMTKVIDIIVAWAKELGIETNEEYYPG